jgi:hypothetical protein
MWRIRHREINFVLTFSVLYFRGKLRDVPHFPPRHQWQSSPLILMCLSSLRFLAASACAWDAGKEKVHYWDMMESLDGST